MFNKVENIRTPLSDIKEIESLGISVLDIGEEKQSHSKVTPNIVK